MASSPPRSRRVAEDGLVGEAPSLDHEGHRPGGHIGARLGHHRDRHDGVRPPQHVGLEPARSPGRGHGTPPRRESPMLGTRARRRRRAWAADANRAVLARSAGRGYRPDGDGCHTMFLRPRNRPRCRIGRSREPRGKRCSETSRLIPPCRAVDRGGGDPQPSGRPSSPSRWSWPWWPARAAAGARRPSRRARTRRPRARRPPSATSRRRAVPATPPAPRPGRHRHADHHRLRRRRRLPGRSRPQPRAVRRHEGDDRVVQRPGRHQRPPGRRELLRRQGHRGHQRHDRGVRAGVHARRPGLGRSTPARRRPARAASLAAVPGLHGEPGVRHTPT